MQRPGGAAFGAVEVARARLRQRVLLVEVLPGLHRRLDLADARQAGLDQLLGAQRAAGDRTRRFAGRQPLGPETIHRIILPYSAFGSHIAMPGNT